MTEPPRNPWDAPEYVHDAGSHPDAQLNRGAKRPRNLHYIIGGLFTLFVGIIAFWSYLGDSKNVVEQRAAKKTAPVDANAVTAPSSAILDGKIREQASAAIEEQRKLGQAPGARGPAAPLKVGEPLPEVKLTPEEEQRLRLATQEQQARAAADKERVLHTALTSPIMAIKGSPSAASAVEKAKQSTGSAALLENVINQRKAQEAKTSDLQARLAGANGANPANGSSGAGGSATGRPMMPAANARSGAGPDLSSGPRSDQQWLADQQVRQPQTPTLEPAPSPYTLIQGSTIPVALLTAVDSSLPGNVTAVVTQDIYDSITNTHLLIPRWSRLWGVYNNDVRIGQGRVMMAFTRLTLPTGEGINLGGMQGTDGLGRAGAPGEVNNHFVQTFGAAFLIAGVDRLINGKPQPSTSPYYGGGSSGPQVLAETGRAVLERNRNIAPTVEIREGERFNILVARNLDLTPVRNSRVSAR